MSEQHVSRSYFEGESSENFKQYEQTVRGHVRYELTKHNLMPFVAGTQLNIVDVGGGTGPDTAWLAAMGHRVTLAEPAEDQLEKAERRFAELDEDVRRNITVLQDTTEGLLARRLQFDMVLSHGVAMYLPNPRRFVKQLGALTLPGGHISLLEKGYDAKQLSLMTKGDREALDYFNQTGWDKQNNVGKAAYAFKPIEFYDLLEYQAGAQVLSWSGVRVLNKHSETPASELNPDDLNELVKAEIEAGNDPKQRSAGHMLHFIAQKPA